MWASISSGVHSLIGAVPSGALPYDCSSMNFIFASFSVAPDWRVYQCVGAATAFSTSVLREVRFVPAGVDAQRQDLGSSKEENMDTRADRGSGIGGISLGGILVIAGVVVMIVWSFWIGLIVALVGLIAFGGFARGKWY
jgi:hypothetical protein